MNRAQKTSRQPPMNKLRSKGERGGQCHRDLLIELDYLWSKNIHRSIKVIVWLPVLQSSSDYLVLPCRCPAFQPFCGAGRGRKYVSQGGRPPTPRGSGVHPWYKLVLEDAIQANFPFTITNLLISVQYVTFFCVEENDLEILFQRIKYGDLAVQIFLDTELS